ncbi:MAG: HvfC family RiPP maturation protein [Gammaproteobacteria bacterium]
MINATPERLKNTQRAFTDYIRDPQRAPLPVGVQKTRMDMYRELFFNNIDSFLAGGFPVLKRILNDRQWHAMVQDFFARHVCSTPYFSEIGEEFLAYLDTRPLLLDNYPLFLPELAHYEWVEMALSISQEEAAETDAVFEDNPCDYALSLSPLAWPLLYRYPVQHLAPQFQPQTPPKHPTYLLVFRDRSCEVRFIEITPLTFALLLKLQEQPGLSAQCCLQHIAETFPAYKREVIHSGGTQIIKDMAKLGVVYRASF